MRLPLIGRLALIAALGVPLVSCQWVNERRAARAKLNADEAIPYGHYF